MCRHHRSWWALLATSLSVVLIALTGGCTTQLPPEAIPAAPPPPPPPPLRPEDGKHLLVAVDDLGSGFNPHLISDQSPLSTAVASLVLPSVFRPNANGELELDTTVASSAEVVSTAPFTVSYELNLAAAWSDNTPIAAEDFVYLWQRMRSEPGVVDSAGYRLITDVRSRAGGKAVDVVFAQPYPHWQRLFDNLLPAHLLKDAPGSWATALADAIPVSGGPFRLSALDRERGQLVLSRNDHYWATPAVLDNLILRRIDTTGMLDGLRTGDIPVAYLWPDEATLAALRELGGAARSRPVPQPFVVQLAMRTDRGVLSNLPVRQAVGAALNRDTLIAVGTGNGAGGVRADAQLLAPSQPGYRPTAPPGPPTRPDPAVVNQQLTAAGYVRDEQGRWTRDGEPLRITIGAPVEQPRFQKVAAEAVKQLTEAGIEATMVTAPGSALITEPTVVPSPPSTSTSASATPSAGPGPLGGGAPSTAPVLPGGQVRPGQVVATPAPPPSTSPSGPSATPGPSSATSSPPPEVPAGVLVDVIVMPRRVGGDQASTTVSNYGCPPGIAGVARPARNSTGFCLPALQPLLDATLIGAVSAEEASGTIESTLWRQLPAIPLFQIVTTVAITAEGERTTGGLPQGALTIGPFGTAAHWQPMAQ